MVVTHMGGAKVYDISSRRLEAIVFDERLLEQLRPPLIYKPSHYFLEDSRAINVPLDTLLPTRARLDGVVNAYKLMKEAAAGRIERRAPISISVRAIEAKRLVVDGNSTYFVALICCWPDIRCLLQDEAG
jgi:hypothetical protein